MWWSKLIDFMGLKGLIYGAILISFISSSVYFLNTWHYAPMEQLIKKVESLKEQLETTDSSLKVCESNLSKQSLESFIEGVGENNETIFIDFDNITY